MGAMRDTLATLDAVIGLTEAWHTTVIANKEGTASLLVVFCLLALRHIPCIDALIIMNENARDVKAVWAGHAVITVVAVDSGIALDE